MINLSVAWSQNSVEIAKHVRFVGSIEDEAIAESSGLIASRRFPGIFWTHNDAGSEQAIYAITKRGKSVGTFQVRGANLNDLEDIAIDDGANLYLADIGDNGRSRSTIAVHQVKEPNPNSTAGEVSVTRTWRLKFPGNRDDAESFIVFGNAGYVITKPLKNGKVTIYRFSLNDTARTITLKTAGKIPVAGAVTAADLSADGRRLGLVTEAGVYVIFIHGNVGAAGTAPKAFTPFPNEFIEGGTFIDSGLLVSAESRELLLFHKPAFNR